MMHKQVKEGKEGARSHNFSAQKRKTLKKILIYFWGRGTAGFSLFPRGDESEG
jgi:hypothetical protein